MRRRVAALAILLLLIVLVVWGLTAAARSGSGSSETTTAPATENITTEPTVPAPSDSTTSSTSASPTTSGSPSSTQPSTTASSTNAAAGKKTCELKDLTITARTSEPSYAAGEQPTFYMSVENPTAADCVVDLNAQQLRFEVYDMASNERIWSDTDCHPAVVTGEETFAPAKARDFEAIWSRKDSQPGRCSNRQEVPAGSYYLHAVIGDHASAPADFTLRP